MAYLYQIIALSDFVNAFPLTTINSGTTIGDKLTPAHERAPPVAIVVVLTERVVRRVGWVCPPPTPALPLW
jgi:hypothetical protein